MNLYKMSGITIACFFLVSFGAVLFFNERGDSESVDLGPNSLSEAAENGEGDIGSEEEGLKWFQTKYLKMPVVFEREINEELKEVILRDLYNIYRYYSDYSVVNNIWPSGDIRPVEYVLDGVPYESTQKIRFERAVSRALAPDLLIEHFGRLITMNGVDYIVIPAELIEEYRDVISMLMDDDGIPKFREFVHDLDNVEEWSLDYEDMVARFYRYKDASQILSNPKNSPERFIQRLAEHQWIMPSLVSIRKFPEGFDIEEGVYFTEVYGFKEGKAVDGRVIIYINGKWKFFALDY